MDLDHDIGAITGNLAILDPGNNTLTVLGTKGIVLPIGTTAERPAGINGLLRINSDTGMVEISSANTWVGIRDFNASSIPPGGVAGQVLVKNSSADYDASFMTLTADQAPAAKHLVAPVKNDTATTILKGTPVYQTGIAGAGFTMLVRPADAADPAKMPAIGVLNETLAPGQEGFALIAGEINGVNTSLFTAGNLIYVAPGGGYTNVRPTTPGVAVQLLGVVTKIHATNGGGYVTGTNSVDLFRHNGSNVFAGWNGSTWVPISTGPGGSNNSLQYNNNGVLDGTTGIAYNNSLQKLVITNSNATNTTLEVLNGAMTADPTQVNQSALYIEVNTDTVFEGMRTYFKRSSSGFNGWITYHYDGATPNIRITDEDDDPPYISFRTIGTGTYNAPLIHNTFGSRGPLSGATTGFSWRIGDFPSGTEIMAVDSNFLRIPTGTTAQRPATPTTGMIRFNTTTARTEEYNGTAWRPAGGTVLQVVTGTIPVSSGTGTVQLTNNVPTATEGRAIWTQTFTPVSATSRLIIQYSYTGAISVNSSIITSVFVGSTNIGSTAQRISAGVAEVISQTVVYSPGTTSPITISCRSGSTSGTSYCNIIGTTTLGGALVSYYTITEIE